MLISKNSKRSDQSKHLLTPVSQSKHNSRPETTRRDNTERVPFEQLLLNPRTDCNDKPSGQTTRRTSRVFTLGSLEKDHLKQASATKSKRGQAIHLPMSNDSTESYCEKHPNRQATNFITQGAHRIMYCEKCSIQMASRGCQLGKLNASPIRRKYDQVDLDQFMVNLNTVLSDLIRRKQQATINIIKCQTEYGRQISTINEYFENLEFVLQVEKNRLYTSILSTKKQTQTEQKQFHSIYQNCILQVNRILDNIVLGRRASLNCYDDILQQYSPKIQKYSQIIKMDSKKFAIKPLKLVETKKMQHTLRKMVSGDYEEYQIENRNMDRTPICKLKVSENQSKSNTKTLQSQYKSSYYDNQQQSSQNNQMVVKSDINLDDLLASVTTPR